MTSPLIVKAAREGQTIARVTPESAGWRRVGFEALRLAPGEQYVGTTAARELYTALGCTHRVTELTGETPDPAPGPGNTFRREVQDAGGPELGLRERPREEEGRSRGRLVPGELLLASEVDPIV